MTLTPERWNSTEARETDFVRLEQHLQDLSKQCLQGCEQSSLSDPRHAAMAKLYAGATRLHQAVLEGRVAEAIVEIGSNLMGCEQMALIVTRSTRDTITLLGSVGLNQEQLTSIRMNARAILDEACMEAVYITSDGENTDPILSSLGITAFVPFWLNYTTKGAIVFFDLLPQRHELDATDRELLTLLSAYAGPCLSTSKRKDQETCE